MQNNKHNITDYLDTWLLILFSISLQQISVIIGLISFSASAVYTILKIKTEFFNKKKNKNNEFDK